MLNFLALSIGFFVAFFTLLPQNPSKNQEVKGVKIATQPIPYYPSAKIQELALVLSETKELELEPTNKPVPTEPPTPTTTPTSAQNSSDPSSFIMNEINDYRSANGLAPFEPHPLVCSFAQTRASEIQGNFSHEGFDQRLQNATLPYPSFTRVAENIADASSYTKVFSMWQNSPSHNQNLLSNSHFGCVAGSGRYFVFESWTP